MSPISEDLVLLERWLQRDPGRVGQVLRRGGTKPPHEFKTRVEALIRRYAQGEIRNNTERFRYQTLTARYNTFSEMWGRRLRALEEGRPLSGVACPTALAAGAGARWARGLARPRRGRSRRERRQRGSAPCGRCTTATSRRAGPWRPGAAVKFESFERLISKQTSRILSDKGAQAVDFRLETKGGKVSLKAKPVK